MRKKTLFYGVSAIFLGYASAALAQDVYVDLSVLDDLGGSAQTLSSPEPLFPVLPPQPKHKVVRKKPVKKAVVKKSEPVVKVEVKEKIEIPAPVDAVIPAVQEHQPIPYVESSEEIVVVDVEPEAPVKPEVSAETETLPFAVEKPAPVEAAPVAAPITPIEVAPVETAPVVEENGLLVDETVEIAPKAAAGLKFDGEVSELDDAQKAQVDAIIASFADAENNKIAIYSYNLDDGVDTFKKKRLSLNRAVEIRSYLLQKGYKNFSIKVLNVDAASNKGNTVEIEELK